MTRTAHKSLGLLILAALGCDPTLPRTAESSVDCSVAEGYEFGSDFSQTIMIFDKSGDSGWYSYADPTKPSVADVISELRSKDPNFAETPLQVSKRLGLVYQESAEVNPPRCGDDGALHVEAHGYNFWGAGFADWKHEGAGDAADGTGFEGISFWARSEPGTEKTFTLYVDDGRTLAPKESKESKGVVVDGICELACTAPPSAKATVVDGIRTDDGALPCIEKYGSKDTGIACIKYNKIRPADQDLNQNGLLDPGDIASGTTCRVPPMQTVCDPACYAGGVQPPTATACVPEPDQCGNSFRTYVTTTDSWQLFLIPWSELSQSPCPNRLDGGLKIDDIRKFEIKVKQGTSTNLWIDRLEFYRRRTNVSQ